METSLRILMIDDDHDDHYITKDVLKELNIQVDIDFISDSTIVFDHLESQKENLPNLILLDKNLPATDGIEILMQLKAHSTYTLIPVVVISGSAFPEEVNEFYRNGASSFITKPSSGKLTKEKIEGFIRYWSEICELPAFQPLPAQGV